MGKVSKRSKKFLTRQSSLKRRGLLKKNNKFGKKFGGKDDEKRERGDSEQQDDQITLPAPVENTSVREYTPEGFLEALNAEDKEPPPTTDFENYEFEIAVPSAKAGKSKKGQKQSENARPVVLTKSLFEKLLSESETSLPALHQVLYAFEAACASAASQPHPQFTFESPQVCADVMTSCLARFEALCNAHCPRPQGKAGRRAGMGNHVKQWNTVEALWRRYLEALLSLAHTSQDNPRLLAAILSTAHTLVPYLSSFEGLSRRWLKHLLQLLLVEEGNVNESAFAVIRLLAITLPMPFINNCVRGLHWAYQQAAEGLEGEAGDHVLSFLGKCIEDVIGLDPWVGYQHAYVYVRDLALQIQKAMALPVEEVDDSPIVHGSYMQCLLLWCQVVGGLAGRGGDGPTIEALAYPLVQILSNTVRRLGSPRYVGMRLLCVRALTTLARACGQHMPVPAFVLDVLRHKTVTMKPKPPKEDEPIDLEYSLPLSSAAVGTREYQIAVVEEAVPLLLEYFAMYSHDMAFPEMAILTVLELRKYLASCKDPRLSRPVKTLLDKIVENSHYMTTRRNNFNGGPRDLDAIVAWCGAEQQKGTPLARYHKQWLATAGVHRAKTNGKA